MDNIASFVSVFATVVTGVATVMLWWVTKNLATVTKQMAEATSRPQLTATLEPNQWSLRHIDLRLSNDGNASAYDVELQFNPELPHNASKPERTMPFQNITVLRPGQVLLSWIGDFSDIKDTTFKVTMTWKVSPTSLNKLSMSYDYSIAHLVAMSRLGAASPLIQIAEEVKKLREDWRSVTSGQKKLEVNLTDRIDRAKQHKEMADWMEENKDLISK